MKTSLTETVPSTPKIELVVLAFADTTPFKFPRIDGGMNAHFSAPVARLNACTIPPFDPARIIFSLVFKLLLNEA